MEILNYIPIGSENAIGRKLLSRISGIKDRSMRDEIHNARHKIPIINLSDGNGYFIPNMNEQKDRHMLLAFYRQEKSRIESETESLRVMEKTLRNCGIEVGG